MLKNMSLKGKLYFGFGILVLLMVVIVAFATVMINTISSSQDEALESLDTVMFTAEIEAAHNNWAQELSHAIVTGEEFLGELDYTECMFGEWYYDYIESEEFEEASTELQQAFHDLEGPHRELHMSAERINETLEGSQGDEEAIEEATEIYEEETLVHLDEVGDGLNEIAGLLESQSDETIAVAQSLMDNSLYAMLGALVIAIVIGVIIPTIVARSVTNPVSAVVNFLQRMVNTSKEISSGNQDLAQRTQEQASSIEHITTNVEEMTSAIESNSANANQADSLSKSNMDSVKRGEEVVKELQGAMEEITQGSHEIQEIISKVNDISFQTNLLALNAAVEAARAGEQGRGFAVVAAEVRNLAGRSAESAKEIEKLIKDSISRVERGNELMNDTESALQEIVDNNQRISDVIGEISASLGEQSTAASDINSAIEEINEVTQQNAALVEEVSSASENMTSEAEEMSEMVRQYKLIDERDIDYTSGGGYMTQNKTPAKGSASGVNTGRSITGGAGRLPAGGGGKQSYTSQPSVGNQGYDEPDFDEDEFEKF